MIIYVRISLNNTITDILFGTEWNEYLGSMVVNPRTSTTKCLTLLQLPTTLMLFKQERIRTDVVPQTNIESYDRVL